MADQDNKNQPPQRSGPPPGALAQQPNQPGQSGQDPSRQAVDNANKARRASFDAEKKLAFSIRNSRVKKAASRPRRSRKMTSFVLAFVTSTTRKTMGRVPTFALLCVGLMPTRQKASTKLASERS